MKNNKLIQLRTWCRKCNWTSALPQRGTMKPLAIITISILAIILAADSAHARDLVEAAQNAQSYFNRIGIAAISIGITIGGILYAIGAALPGRILMMSGAIGAFVILSAPAFLNLLGKIFGASV